MAKVEELRKDKKLGVSFKCCQNKKYIFGDTVDELIDALALLKDGKCVNEFVSMFKNLSEEQLEKLDVIILDSKNCKEISNYASSRGSIINVEDAENTLISLCEQQVAYPNIVEFAKNVKGANIAKLQDAMLTCKNSCLMLRFVNEIPEADPHKFKEPLEKIGDLCDLISFYKKYQDNPEIISKEDIKNLQQKVIDNKLGFIMYLFARDIKGADVLALEDAMIQTGDPRTYLDFARDVKGADIKKIGISIMKTKNGMYINAFCTEFGMKKKRFFFL